MSESSAAAALGGIEDFAGTVGPTPVAAKPVQAIPMGEPAADKIGPFVVGSRLDLLRNVEMDVTAQLGSTRMTVRELLSLAPGNIVELNRAAGSPIDLMVNGTLIARGEVVVVDEEFGLRISEIVNPTADEQA